MCVCVCVCVCERETETERQRQTDRERVCTKVCCALEGEKELNLCTRQFTQSSSPCLDQQPISCQKCFSPLYHDPLRLGP